MDIAYYRRIPKVELHQHLDGSLRIETILDLARLQGVDLPEKDPEKLKNLLVPGQSSLVEYLKAFDITVSVLQTAASLNRAAYEAAEDWAKDGVIYGELRFAPELHQKQGLALSEAVQAVMDGLTKARREFGVESSVILCALRHTDHSEEIASLLAQFPGTAFDLAGPERGFPVSLHTRAFQKAKAWGCPVTCHAGEAAGLESIQEAVEIAHAQRLGHGTRLVDDLEDGQGKKRGTLAQNIYKHQIHLEVCLTSNIQTQAAPCWEQHPFPLFYHQGFSVSLCTDNPLMSHTTLSQELQIAADCYGLVEKDLYHLQAMALKSAFCSPQIQEQLLEKWPTIRGL